MVLSTIELETYVDNQLVSRDSEQLAKDLVINTRECLQDGGFQMVKYASSHTSVVEHLQPEARSKHQVQSLSLDLQEGEAEPAFGLG